MPIDPSILSSGGTKLQDPLEQYTNFLQAKNMMSQNALSKAKMDEYQREQNKTNALNNALSAGYDSATGKVDYNKVRANLATGRFASAIPDIDEAEVKRNKADIENQKMTIETAAAKSKLFSDKLEQVHQQLQYVTTPEELIQLTTRTHSDPVFGEGQDLNKEIAEIQAHVANGTFADYLQKQQIGVLEHIKNARELDKIAQAKKEFALKASEHDNINLDLGDHRQVLSVPKYGKATPTVISDNRIGASPNATKVTTNVVNNIIPKIETKYGETFASGMADRDLALYDGAQKAPELAQRADRILDVLESGKVITGWGADFRLSFAKALNLVGGNDAETIANTEATIADLANNTLGAIKSSGLGSGQGFTDKDREFLEKAVGGKITLNKETLKRLTLLARHSAEQSIVKWNTRAKDIKESAMRGTGVRPSEVPIPSRPRKTPTKGTPAKPKSKYNALWGD